MLRPLIASLVKNLLAVSHLLLLLYMIIHPLVPLLHTGLSFSFSSSHRRGGGEEEEEEEEEEKPDMKGGFQNQIVKSVSTTTSTINSSHSSQVSPRR
jgi:hypothetical protein